MSEIKEKLKEYFKDNPGEFGDWLCKLAFGTKLFPYQRKFIEDRSKRLIFVGGRQTGKCIWRNQKVMNAKTGEIKTIEEWFKDGGKLVVYALDLNTYEIRKADALVYYTGRKKIYKVSTYKGYEIYVSPDHRILTKDGWKKLSGIEVGERVVVSDDGKVCYDEIVSIEYIGEDDAYDIEVPEYHNFIINNVVVHNSTICAIRSLWRAWCFDNQTILVVSRTGRQSKVMAKKIRTFLMNCNILENDKRIFNTEVLEFENGSAVYFLPGEPDNVRGFSADSIIVDEAAFVPDDLFTVIEPAVMATDGEIIMISSPFKKEGYFYEAVQSGMWSVHRVTCYDNPLISDEDIEKFRLTHTEAEFKREMLAQFADDSTEVYVPISVLENAMVGEKHNGRQEGWYYVIGCDIARFGNDKTVFAVVGLPSDEKLSDGTLYVVNLYIYKKKSLYTVINALARIIDEWRPELVMIDSNGLGAAVFDILKEKFGHIIEDAAPLSRGQRRIKAYMDVRNLLNDGRLKIFRPDTKELRNEIISHFMNIELDLNERNGQLKIVKKPGKGNDDIVDAIVYAVAGWHLIGFNTVKYEVAPEIDIDKIVGVPKDIDNSILFKPVNVLNIFNDMGKWNIF